MMACWECLIMVVAYDGMCVGGAVPDHGVAYDGMLGVSDHGGGI